jgi:hypothetical protein
VPEADPKSVSSASIERVVLDAAGNSVRPPPFAFAEENNKRMKRARRGENLFVPYKQSGRHARLAVTRSRPVPCKMWSLDVLALNFSSNGLGFPGQVTHIVSECVSTQAHRLESP